MIITKGRTIHRLRFPSEISITPAAGIKLLYRIALDTIMGKLKNQ